MSATTLAPYFSLGTVMEGLNGLLGNLYDVSLEVEEPAPGELWANDIYKLAGEHYQDYTYFSVVYRRRLMFVVPSVVIAMNTAHLL